MILFIASGIIFVSGAIGFETLGGFQHKVNGSENVLYAVLYTCEELLEMLGIAIFAYTLLAYIGEQFEGFYISFNKPEMDSDK